MVNARHILLVEDDDELRDLTRMTLETFGGHRVTACASGAEAVRCAAGQLFDLLLLDVMMPEMGGFDTLAALRELHGLAQVPAVFLTGRTQAQELEAYRQYNIADVIAKPFDPGLLCDRLASLLAGCMPVDVAASVAPEALVIEDDLSILYLVQFILEEQGYRVRSATDGKQGREAIKEGPAAQAAVVVLDISLPEEDGLQLLTRLRADPRWNKVPVLVLSALRDEATMRRAFAAGADDYLNKPFDPHQGAERIKRLIKGPLSSLAEPATTSS
jgi:CheY-like chemotaxis protein